MTVTYLADADTAAYLVGRIVAALVLPVLGVNLLIIGQQKRSAARKQASSGYQPGYPAPGYPPPASYPPGYPAPGQPGYTGYPPGSGSPIPPPQPPKPAGTGFITTGIVLLAIGALGIVGSIVAVGARQTHRLAIGDCFTNEILTGRSDWHPSSCSDPEAVLEYAADADSNGNCPDGKRTESAYLSVERGGSRICFAPNLTQGECYISERDDRTVEHASCTTARTIRIVKRIDGSTDTSDCPAGTRYATYKVPKRIYCTERAGGR